jgi:hypothetical protein
VQEREPWDFYEGIVEKRGEEETKSMPQVPVIYTDKISLKLYPIG